MENKPEYRIRVIIEDVNVGEEIVNESDAVYSNDDDTVMVAVRAIEHFHNRFKETHEATHYPKDEE